MYDQKYVGRSLDNSISTQKSFDLESEHWQKSPLGQNISKYLNKSENSDESNTQTLHSSGDIFQLVCVLLKEWYNGLKSNKSKTYKWEV